MNILIIEDELPSASKLERLVREIEPSCELAGVLESIEAAIAWFKKNPQPDLIFMDIHLADGSSFEIFKECEVEAPVIFTTAYDEYAIDAFKVNSVDYLLKPVKREELESAILKFKNLQFKYSRMPIDTMLENTSKQYKDVFVIRIGTKIKTLSIDQIAYFYSKGKLSYVCDKDGRSYPVSSSLEKIQALLDPILFFRVNRQILTHRNSIKEIHMLEKSRIKLDLEPVTNIESFISTERTSIFKKWLNKEV